MKKRKLEKVGKKDLFLQRIAPEQLLTGWRGWWSRVEELKRRKD